MSTLCQPITKAQSKYLKELAEITIEAALGGKNTISYRMLADECMALLREEMCEEFGTSQFTKICSCRFMEVVVFLADWFPTDDIMELSCELEEALSRFIYRIVDDIPKNCPAYKEIMEDFINAVCTSSEGLE